ncbi:hypothetical protein IEQ34_001034 [Dendrobium chrysotoxum]|uniref:Uncharacterized protein n=1 Tax=Dendrobium chrysotoxum TaxID=161865 RepID=A0AAV7HLF7_DENCH|nr:hypothetical protein IEQ34_001034 [Dendrobium chrysotoxum]
MEPKFMSVGKRDTVRLGKENQLEEPFCSHVEKDENRFLGNQDEQSHVLEKEGEASSMGLSKETPVSIEDNKGTTGVYRYSTKKHKFVSSTIQGFDVQRKDKARERRLNRQERIELGRKFQEAVSIFDWDVAQRLIMGVDIQILNDALCIALDSIWFLSSRQELNGITQLINLIISNGAHDYTRAVLRTSFLASCVSACKSSKMSYLDTQAIMAHRLHERLQECNGDEILKAEASAKVQKFTEWAMRCIGIHSRGQGSVNNGEIKLHFEIQLQLSAFRSFLDLAGDQLTGKDFTEAFDAACFPLTLFSSSFETGWASTTSAATVRGMLGMLVEGGADNINQCLLEASRFGSTELVQILLQIAERNNLDVDIDLALGLASYYCKFGTMECLVEEGHASAFLDPLVKAAERGCKPVVEWFINHGCTDMELCRALTAATSNNQVDIAAYLLPCVPLNVLSTQCIEILKMTAERGSGSLDGVAFLLRSNFLGDPIATYAVADDLAMSDAAGAESMELSAYLREYWSEAAFTEGMRLGQEHYLNFSRVLRRGESPISLSDLPAPLSAAIAFLPLYRECLKAGGPLLPQKLRGELVEAVRRLQGLPFVNAGNYGSELVEVLERNLPSFLLPVRCIGH